MLITMGISVLALPLRGATQASTASADLLWQHRNLGKAFYENPTTKNEAVDEFRKALQLAPDSARERLNYGLALLRAGKVEAGIAELQKVQRQDPTIPHTWFNLGIEFKRRGDNDAAIRQFQGMIRLVPDEPISHYNLGVLYKLSDKKELALAEFEVAEKLNPNLAGPHFQLYNAYRDADRGADAARELATFNQIKHRPANDAVPEDLEWSAYAEIYDTLTRGVTGSAPFVPPRFESRKIGSVSDAETAGLAVLDTFGDGSSDLLAWSRDGVQIFRRAETPLAKTGLEQLRDVTFVAIGDLDNDGLPDLCVLTSAGAALYINRGEGKFEPLPANLPAGKFTRALWLDYDHDYDLDLFLFGEKSYLLQNQGPAGFHDVSSRFPFASGHAVSAVDFELHPDNKERDLVVTYADRSGVLYRDEQAGNYVAVPIEALPAGASSLTLADLNNDGWMDLVAATPSALVTLSNHEGKFEASTLKLNGSQAIAALDIANSGAQDLVVGGTLLRNRDGHFNAEGSVSPAFRAVASADFDGDGQEDLATVTPDGAVHLFLNRTGSSNHWMTIRLAGVKNQKLAAGSAVEVKAGSIYQKRIYEGVPLSFGLGHETEVDTVRITWPNGLVQNEIRPSDDHAAFYKEKPRLSGSCPMIFAWNGRAFSFVSDVLGVAPLGASDGEGHYFPVNHREYVKIPAGALRAIKGRYELRVTEELHEVSYLDQLQLVAIDHSKEAEVFTNDKFKSPPFPEFRLFGVHHKTYPQRAVDERGRNVLPAVLKRDGAYVAGFAHDAAGVAETHSIELDFGSAAADNRALLVLNGWVDWADGSTFLARAEEGKGGLIFPYLQVEDGDGQWQTVIADMGMPSGKPRTIVVDLSGKFLSKSREVRIVTNLCVYWDEIYLSEDSAAPHLRTTMLTADRARLNFRGFSRVVIDPARMQPEKFLYAQVAPASSWNPVPGMYTRYGDVQSLVSTEDDRMVVMGAGDELRLSFPASALPPLPVGWVRDFFVMVDGWAKDNDSNTAFSNSVDPLPFHGMSSYPYPSQQGFPDDDLHRRYQADYLTRPALKLLRPLNENGTVIAAPTDRNLCRAGQGCATDAIDLHRGQH